MRGEIVVCHEVAVEPDEGEVSEGTRLFGEKRKSVLGRLSKGGVPQDEINSKWAWPMEIYCTGCIRRSARYAHLALISENFDEAILPFTPMPSFLVSAEF